MGRNQVSPMYNIERSPFFRGSFFPRRIHVNKSVHLEEQVQYVRAATYIITMCYNFVPSPTNSCVAWSHSGAARIPFVTRAKKAFLTCTHTHTHENPSYAHRWDKLRMKEISREAGYRKPRFWNLEEWSRSTSWRSSTPRTCPLLQLDESTEVVFLHTISRKAGKYFYYAHL